MQVNTLTMQVLEPFIGKGGTFCPFPYEISAALGNRTVALVYAALCSKFLNFNRERKTHQHFGKNYHFFYNQKTLGTELLMDEKTVRNHIKKLAKKGLIRMFSARNDKNYNTTYFFFDFVRIEEVYKEGCKLLGKRVDKEDNALLPTQKKYTTPPKQQPSVAEDLLNLKKRLANGEINRYDALVMVKKLEITN